MPGVWTWWTSRSTGPSSTVFVDRDGGVGLDQLGEATRDVSAALDELDPMPGRYTLSVSSPGLERPAAHPGAVRPGGR